MFYKTRKRTYFAKFAVLMLLAIIPQWAMAAPSNPLGVVQAGTDRALQIIRASHEETRLLCVRGRANCSR